MTSMNPLEQEILKYEKKGFKVEQKRTLKYGSRTFLCKKKGYGFLTGEAIYIYYVDGSATTDSFRECFKDYEKYYKEKEGDFDIKGFFLCSGSCDEKLFRDLRQAMIRKNSIRNSIRLVAVEGKGKKTVERSKDVEEEKPKRVRLTAKQRIYVWEHPEKYGRKCNICSGKIVKISDLELDHTVPYSKGGTKMALAHRDCNRMKGSKNLRHVQTKMKFKT
jgi:5-methylcytosine-specific restriction endonuclease McrA